MNVPKSLLPPLIVAIFGLAMIVQSVSGLRCYTGGGAGAAAIYVPHDCKADHTLCEFKNTTVAGVTMKLAQGCAMPSMDRKPGTCDLEKCYCNTDLCNGQSPIKAGTLAPVIAFIIALKFFN